MSAIALPLLSLPNTRIPRGSGLRAASGMFLIVVLAAAGCAPAGPASISNGRAVYNEVINTTDDEQLLNVIVRERYQQTFGMLTVASVTASIKVSGNAAGQFGIGPESNYAGNLVPLSAGVAYEESPTISYVPLNGELFLSRMLAPISLSEAFLLVSAADNDATWTRQLVARVNGMENTVDQPPPPKVQRFFELQMRLRKVGVLVLGTRATTQPTESQYFVQLTRYQERYTDEVREFLDVLGFTDIKADGSDILLPVVETPAGGVANTMHLQLRSALDVIRIAGRAIQIPAEQRKSGIAPALPSSDDMNDQLMTIHTSKNPPRNAVVAIPFRGWWYYVDATDTRSKRAFKMIRLLVGLRLQEKSAPGPVLTIPAR